MDWDEIECLTEAYQGGFEGALALGERPMPIGISIRRGMCDESFEITRTSLGYPIHSVEDVHSLAEEVSLRSRDCFASGMVALVPRKVACELLNIPPEGSASVAVLHMEHVTDGTKTWVLDVPNYIPVGDWDLVSKGSWSKLPPFFHTLRYGLGGAAKC
jgi:hypothetical protein